MWLAGACLVLSASGAMAEEPARAAAPGESPAAVAPVVAAPASSPVAAPAPAPNAGTIEAHAENSAPLPPAEVKPNQRRRLAAAAAATPPVPAPQVAAGPSWAELTAAQRIALAPLVSAWPQLELARKQKWIALSANFASLSDKEQALLHSRMRDWASLSANERTLARLNFSGVRDLSAAERLERWEAYQALPKDERLALRSNSGPKTPGAAVAVKPTAVARLAVVKPVVAVTSATGTPEAGRASPARAPVGARIASNPDLVDAKTLLPHLVAVPPVRR